MWFVGDTANLIGAAWAELVPVVVAIAVYFCLADGVLITQCLYYNIRNARREKRKRKRSNRESQQSRRSSIETPTPTTPLLGRRFSDDVGLPGSHRRRSSASMRDGHSRRPSYPDDTLARIVEENETGKKAWVKNVLSILVICVIGGGGWAIAWQTGLWIPTPEEHGRPDTAIGAQVLGYFSAICYLG